MPRTVLHLGAHKTATTYIQKKLARNQPLLKSKDVQYYKLEQLRKAFTPLVYGSGKEKPAFIEKMAQAAATTDVVISEENILGMAGELMKKGAFYPDVASRLRKVIKALGVEAPAIYLSTREYSAFVVSMYCEYLRHQPFIPFETYMDVFRKSGFSWVKVIGDIRSAAPGAEIYLWDFSRFRETEHAILTHMIGFDAALLTSSEESVRESFSSITISAYQALGSVLEGKEHRKMLGILSQEFPRGEQYPAFQPLQDDEISRYRQAYAADMAEISERIHGVVFLG